MKLFNLSLCSLLILTQADVKAEQISCAYLSTSQSITSPLEHLPLILTKHNGKHLNQPIKAGNSDTVVGVTRKLILESGTHTFTAFAGKKAKNCEVDKNLAFNSPHIQCSHYYEAEKANQFDFTVNVTENQQYNLVAARVTSPEKAPLNEFEAKVILVSNHSCKPEQDAYVFNALLPFQPLYSGASIPEELKYEYNQLIMEISNYLSTHNNGLEIINIVREQVNEYVLGMSGRLVKQGTTFGFQVGFVEPASTASSMGLTQGDIISKINDTPFASLNPNDANNLLGQIIPEQEFKFTVIRDKSTFNLNGVFQPIVYPNFAMSVEIGSIGLGKDILAETQRLSKYRQDLIPIEFLRKFAPQTGNIPYSAFSEQKVQVGVTSTSQKN